MKEETKGSKGRGGGGAIKVERCRRGMVVGREEMGCWHLLVKKHNTEAQIKGDECRTNVVGCCCGACSVVGMLAHQG